MSRKIRGNCRALAFTLAKKMLQQTEYPREGKRGVERSEDHY
jgi:hypothetical protein